MKGIICVLLLCMALHTASATCKGNVAKSTKAECRSGAIATGVDGCACLQWSSAESPTCEVLLGVDTFCEGGDQLARFGAAVYTDGFAAMPQNRPNPRMISNLVGAQTGDIHNARGASDWLWQWGQFVDHDVIATPAGGDSANIPVPANDPAFDPFNTGTQELSFTRSLVYEGTGLAPGNPRQQINSISSCIDGSNVYGSDVTRQAALRTNDGTGRLKTSAGDLMPFNTAGLENEPSHDSSFFLAGDVRANEQIGLTAAHTLFVREHNWHADRIANLNLGLDGNEIFRRARKIVTAEIQKITYEDWLPIFIGKPMPAYQGYQSLMAPAIFNEFATAAFRVGHTLLSNSLARPAVGSAAAPGDILLADAFFTTAPILSHGIDTILKGLAIQKAQEVDGKFVDGVRNMLFGPPGAGGTDLFSLNIQRGRDHGIPRLNEMRAAMAGMGYNTPQYTSFSEITSNPTHAADLQSLYGSVDEVELFVGGLLEDKDGSSMLGRTFECIWVEQFRRFREGYKHFYLNDPEVASLYDVSTVTLRDIILRNSAIPSAELPADVFIA